MMIIITKTKAYKWDYKKLLTNLLYVTIAISFVILYLIVSKMDYNTMMGL